MALYIISRGGFGNVLFGYMVGYAVGKKYNMKQIYTTSAPGGHRKGMHEYPIFRVEYGNIPPNCNIFSEPRFPYTPINISDPTKNWALNGYFQSYKYSFEYIPEMKQIFTNFPKYPQMRKVYNNCSGGKPTILLHVRRGDYVHQPQYHPLQTDEYYIKSIETIKEKIGTNFKILAFSDDISFLYGWKVLKDYDHSVITLTDEIETFILMTMCDHYIIANSSFSLLSYYFRDNQDAYICAPKNWFGPSCPRYELDDLIPPSDNRYLY